jgi:hypothetical protein
VADYLLIIGDCDALQWVLNKRRMAFPPHRERLAGELSRGDRVFLYTTRSCWRNPTRDRGRIAGVGRVISEGQALPQADRGRWPAVHKRL